MGKSEKIELLLGIAGFAAENIQEMVGKEITILSRLRKDAIEELWLMSGGESQYERLVSVLYEPKNGVKCLVYTHGPLFEDIAQDLAILFSGTNLGTIEIHRFTSPERRQP
jgi:hypothetical protein